MSLATWKAEFYQTAADAVEEEDAIAHSLIKWRGLRVDALENHGMILKKATISDGCDSMNISGACCALCHHYVGYECDGCPIVKVNDGHACDDYDEDPDLDVWYEFSGRGNPEPMISLLEKALERQGGKL